MKLWWKVWLLVLGIKLILGAWLPLTPDEAYYWVWSQHLQLSYYDHPPMVAWLMRLGHLFPQWGVRFPAILLAHVGLIFWAGVFRSSLSQYQQVIFLVMASVMPLIGPGSLIVTPDIPLVFSWAFSLWAFQRLLDSNGSMKSAMILGLALGLGVLSKYHIVLIAPVLLGWWYFTKTGFPIRRWLAWTLLVMFLVATPVWLWNYQNDWASIRFQLSHGLGRPEWKPSWTMEYVLVQVGLLFPTVVWLALKARMPRHLLLAGWIPMAFFLMTSFRGYVEGNWPIAAHPAILGLAIMSAQTFSRALIAPLVLWCAGLAFILSLNALSLWPEWVWRTKLSDLRSYDTLNQKTVGLAPLYAPSYQIASLLSFRQQREIDKLRGMNRRDFFDYLPGSNPSGDKFFLILRKTDEIPETWRSWTQVQVIPIEPNLSVVELARP